ncbi:MAG: endonuclease V [Myxococcales bacterium]|nr:MAG: endonuclease V [Myxococcales bacterium]
MPSRRTGSSRCRRPRCGARPAPAQAIARQNELRERLVLQPPPGLVARRIAGADISMNRFADWAAGAFVVLDAATREPVAQATVVTALTFPYVPGLLSFRELPVLAQTWSRLATKPDVVVFDGQGIAHPRRLGIASHGGLMLGVPTIGCAKSLLCGRHGELADRRGATADLIHQGEVVGQALRTRPGVAPVYVSPGHLMDLPTAVELVLQMTSRYREPETTRHAHRLANEARRAEMASRGEAQPAG